MVFFIILCIHNAVSAILTVSRYTSCKAVCARRSLKMFIIITSRIQLPLPQMEMGHIQMFTLYISINVTLPPPHVWCGPQISTAVPFRSMHLCSKSHSNAGWVDNSPHINDNPYRILKLCYSQLNNNKEKKGLPQQGHWHPPLLQKSDWDQFNNSSLQPFSVATLLCHVQIHSQPYYNNTPSWMWLPKAFCARKILLPEMLALHFVRIKLPLSRQTYLPCWSVSALADARFSPAVWGLRTPQLLSHDTYHKPPTHNCVC